MSLPRRLVLRDKLEDDGGRGGKGREGEGREEEEEKEEKERKRSGEEK